MTVVIVANRLRPSRMEIKKKGGKEIVTPRQMIRQ